MDSCDIDSDTGELMTPAKHIRTKTEDRTITRNTGDPKDQDGEQNPTSNDSRRIAERRKGGKRDSKPALVKKELDQLLEYKRRELRELEEGTGKSAVGGGLKSIQEDLQTAREQVEGLESHLRSREQVEIRREIEDEKR
ncbi:Actin cytoskeleton-regulatory complex protein END3 [Fusarium duplospermum]|uniref:Actin cytoskeleton-regulatory complex protein END3 n=1 Tax=Fusarium duplospermum TaxID=1325734 RepID=A0A428NFP0_9HYPO|nr:Actin cytoskeleton-regulatory complex protein END3 [Fusarium duplospermum]